MASDKQGRPSFQVGQEVGGFLIQELLGHSEGGTSYLAQAPNGGQTMAIKAVSVAEDATYQRLRQYVQASSGVKHRNLARLYGVGREGDVAFIAMEYIEGQSLASYQAQRRQRGEHFGRQAAFNIAAHLCNGLQALHSYSPHGVINPENVYVTKTGRFKLTNLAYARYVGEVLHAQGRGVLHSSGFVAPEVRQDPSQLTEASDIYSLAMLVCELLSAQPLLSLNPDPRRAAMEVAAQISPAVFSVIEKALALDPAARPRDAGVLRESLHVLTEESEIQAGGEPATPVGGMAAVPEDALPPTGIPLPSGLALPSTQESPAEMSMGAIPSLDLEPDPSMMALEQQVQQAEADLEAQAAPQAAQEEDDPFAAAARALGGPRTGELSTLAGDTSGEKRYLVSRDGLDYGPYTGQEVLAQLHKDEISEHTSIMDRLSQLRTPLGEMPEFFDAVRAYIPKREERRRIEAETRAARIQTAKKAGKWTGVVGAVAALAIFGVWLVWFYYIRPQPAPLPSEQLVASLGQEYRMAPPPREFAQIALDDDLVKQLFAPDEPEDGGQRRRPGVGRRKAGGAGLGADDDDENISTLDMGAEGGSTHILTDAEVQSTVRRKAGALGVCMRAELKRDPGFKGVSIKFFIKPTGTTGGVKIVGGGSTTLVQCLKGHVRTMKFPQHGGLNRGVTLPFYIQ